MPTAQAGGALRAKYIEPPLSVIDLRSKGIKDRRQQWEQVIGVDTGDGRPANLLGTGLQALDPSGASSTSIFNPVLAELAMVWFAPRPQHHRDRPVIVVDPFAGGAVRGLVASYLGFLYIGIDISQEQVQANKEKLKRCDTSTCSYKPMWVQGDGEDVGTLVRRALRRLGLDQTAPADFVFSCPPYFNLEKYTDHPADLSNLPSTAAFEGKYARIIAECAKLLRHKHLACFVVGNMRPHPSTGELFKLDTCTDNCFKAPGVGCVPINTAQITTPTGHAPQRAGRIAGGAKLTPVHQTMCVYAKGTGLRPQDAREIGLGLATMGRAPVGSL